MSRLLKRIDRNCRNYPDRIAFIDENRSITYRQLWEESGRICSWLKNSGCGKDDICLIVLPRSASSIASLLGVLRAGCAFCNIDSSNPAEKISFIRRDLHQKCEIDEETYRKIQSSERPYDGYIESDPHDAAFVIYTSGYAGRIKGVLHEMGNLDFCLSLYPDLREYEGFHTCLAVSFDRANSIHLILNCMCIARTVHITPMQLTNNVRGMHRYLVQHQITDACLPTSFVRLYQQPSAYLKEILMSSENADNLYYESGRPSLTSFYSLSESCFPLLVMNIDRKYEHAPAGRPVLKQLDLHLEDQNGNRIEGPGQGEICFRNFYVRGYVDLPEETTRVFREGIVHTGDIARRDAQGLYSIVGRLDDMFRINGICIEPSEVESLCRKALGLSWCAVKGFEKQETIALYYTDDIIINEKEACQKLGSILPYYLIPSYYIRIAKPPVSAEGKIYRKALKLPEENIAAEYVAPRNEIEQKLTEAMAEVLEINRLGIRDDFFRRGGNSLKAIQLLEKLNIEGLNISHIYEGCSAEKISELLETEKRNSLSLEEKEAIGKTKRFPLDPNLKHRWSESSSNCAHDFMFAYQLAPMIKIEKLENAINEYIRNDSAFNAFIDSDGEEPVQAYSENAPTVKIENMSVDEVRELLSSFIRPFGFKEPLIRIRLIRTHVFRYLFFQMSSLLSDDSGLVTFLKDIAALYKGGTIRPVYYFAYLFERSKPISKEITDEALDHFIRKLDPENRMCSLSTDVTGKSGQGVTRTIFFPMNKIEELVAKYDSTDSAFVHLVVSLAQEKYNGKVSCVYTQMLNRWPKENPAGIKETIAPIGITSESRAPADLFKDMEEQHRDLIRLSYLDHREHIQNRSSIMMVSYDPYRSYDDRETLALGIKLKLENRYVSAKTEQPVLQVRVLDDGERMMFTLNYDMKYLSIGHAEEFVTIMKNIGDALLEDKIID